MPWPPLLEHLDLGHPHPHPTGLKSPSARTEGTQKHTSCLYKSPTHPSKDRATAGHVSLNTGSHSPLSAASHGGLGAQEVGVGEGRAPQAAEGQQVGAKRIQPRLHTRRSWPRHPQAHGR